MRTGAVRTGFDARDFSSIMWTSSGVTRACAVGYAPFGVGAALVFHSMGVHALRV